MRRAFPEFLEACSSMHHFAEDFSFFMFFLALESSHSVDFFMYKHLWHQNPTKNSIVALKLMKLLEK